MSTYYDELKKRAEAFQERAKARKVLRRAGEVQLEGVAERGNRQAYLLSPSLGFALATMDLHLSQVPPGGKTNFHRHFNEAIIYILEGKGFSIIDGQRFEWEKGDCFCIPVYAWHQHGNSHPTEPAVYLAVTNVPLMEGLGLFRLEHQEGS